MQANGIIIEVEEVATLTKAERKALGLVPIPHGELESLRQANIAERMAWHAKRLGERRDAEARRIARNKRKAQR